MHTASYTNILTDVNNNSMLFYGIIEKFLLFLPMIILNLVTSFLSSFFVQKLLACWNNVLLLKGPGLKSQCCSSLELA